MAYVPQILTTNNIQKVQILEVGKYTLQKFTRWMDEEFTQEDMAWGLQAY